MMQCHYLEQIRWLEYGLLAGRGLRQGTFLRSGGVSAPPFNELNLSFDVGDHSESVQENIRRVVPIIGQEPVICTQVHGNEVRVVEAQPKGEIVCDGLITAQESLPLGIKHADCQAAIFFDPHQRIIGIAHSGWKGLVLNIYQNMVATMSRHFNCKSQDLHVVISPSLGPKHAQFIHWEKEFPISFAKFQVAPNYFNLWDIGDSQLRLLGIPESQIYNARTCTFSKPEDYFSYRRDKTTGRHLTYVMLNKSRAAY